ncbi:MAG: rifampicin phosphotransferase [Actinomycetota bacterium]|jgi:pyruvate,water dikinase|nr:rifampicin phosphotransferase [Actinomycetota bacterium]
MPMSDPLHWESTDPRVLWSPGNVSEAIPGVSTTLNWSFVGDAIELASRRAFASIGVLSRAEVSLPARAEDRLIVAFFGRAVANIDQMRIIGDRLPGTSANGVEEQLFGVVRAGAENHPSYRRWPVVAVRLPAAAARLIRNQREARRATQQWWRRHVLDPPVDVDAARALLVDAGLRYRQVFELGVVASMLASALYDQVAALACRAGCPGLEHRLVTGYAGMEETALLRDLWALSRRHCDLDTFLLRHGFHGPDEGQMASRVWREDTAPLLALADHYAGLDDAFHPGRVEARQQASRASAEAELAARVGPLRAPGARVLLRLARRLIPQREVGKANYTQCLDGARLAARVLGRTLTRAGRLADPDDVFHLTVDELLTGGGADLRMLVDERRRLRAGYETYELPDRWTGPPVPVPATRGRPVDGRSGAGGAAADGTDAGGGPVTGVAVGGGEITGRARVVLDPATADLEAGEILVCHSTDPGWVALFHLAGGVVVDTGGQMSHGAIVARELGLPCVTGTGDGTRRLRTGDLIRVDGATGRVELLDGVPVGGAS